jgi:hypothetical protein
MAQDKGWGSCDPYVVIKFAENKLQTFVARNTLNPQWEEGLVSGLTCGRTFDLPASALSPQAETLAN